ncbi:hypothetical protein ABVK25_000393 [Lepraria finkii]|uniref:mRNA 3'-end-processing protein RNA14 n=1 Tax=Lepraria finkii TaxID=1340010 RepID=A0ABR4BQA4_9LECA
MADEEAAFLSSMQAANEAAGYENGEGSEEQAASSSDEYDPTQAVQTDLRPPSKAQDPSVQASSHDVSFPDPTPSASAIPLTSTSISATLLRNDIPQSGHQSLSRSMSRASSQSSEENFTTGTQHLNKGTPSHTDGVGEMGQAGENGAADMEQKSSLHPVSDSSFNNSTNHVPADNVQIQNDVQAQNPSGLVQNGATNTVPNLAAVLPDTGASSHSESTLKPSMTLPAPSMTEAPSSTRAQPPTPSTSAPRARLPHDTIGILEDRIKEDPRGDLQAWLHLINEHKKRAKVDDARSVYERFLSVFPTAGEEWVSYAQMENEAQNRTAMDKILSRALPQNPYVPVWSMYLDHIRRHNNLTTDSSGQARQIIHQAYDVAMQYVGLDKDSGKLWVDYIQFIKSGPGIIGGSNWQDQQKMDLLRKIYQRAICIPTEKTNPLWKEYDGFEMGLNKITGRKFLQDQSPHTCRHEAPT